MLLGETCAVLSDCLIECCIIRAKFHRHTKQGLFPRQGVCGKRWGFGAFLTNSLYRPLLVLQASVLLWDQTNCVGCALTLQLSVSLSLLTHSPLPACPNARAHHFQNGAAKILSFHGRVYQKITGFIHPSILSIKFFHLTRMTTYLTGKLKTLFI